jgi:hypothetical protein
VSVTAYHSFTGEVEASNTPTIRRLTLSRRHQLSPIALVNTQKDIFTKPVPVYPSSVRDPGSFRMPPTILGCAGVAIAGSHRFVPGGLDAKR